MDNKNGFNLSFEFFPPKTQAGIAKLEITAKNLASLHPYFFSITFGAGGSTREGTLDTLKLLQNHTSISIAPHLACIGSSRADLKLIIEEYKKNGVNRIIALRGDLPSGMGQSGELKYARDLVTLIRETAGDHFHIVVAAYPELHPQTKCAQDEIMNFKSKIDAGANSAITQYFFNADAYFYFRDTCAKYGILNPIVPGIMPITQFTRLVQFSNMCGAEIPRWMRKQFESYEDDIDSIKAFGMDVIYKLCETLILGGVPGLHFYTLNNYDASLNIVNALKKNYPSLLTTGTSQKDQIT